MLIPRSLRRTTRLGGVAFLLCLFGVPGIAAAVETPDRLFREAETARLNNPEEFESSVNELMSRSQLLSLPQQEHLKYLLGWRSAYKGNYQEAVAELTPIANGAADYTIRFRAAATIVNVTALAKQYELAFTQLRNLLELLPKIKDLNAREQGLSVTAYLYNLIGERELALRYAKILKDENYDGRGLCTGGHLELQAIYKDRSMRVLPTKFQETIDACERANERVRANAVRLYLAKRLMDDGRFDDAIRLLSESYDGVLKLGSPQLTSDFEASLAQAYRQVGNTALARKFALYAVETAVKNEYTEQLVVAYRLLYLLAKEHGDTKSALDYHEKFAAADKGYVDDVSGRQLAYQRVQHEVVANKLQIETLNKQNQVLQLQRQLSDKAVENIRLYIVLLVVVLVFIVLWAYKTKRSQLHFMKLSRRDGLTGVVNRPHFIDLAERVLGHAESAKQDVCVVVCDLDHFKKINDTYGHAAGDSVLKQVSALFDKHLRKDDIFGRLGGEEFGVVLPECDGATAQQRCEQLRVALSKITVSDESDAATTSASFGISCTTTSQYELRQLLADADGALYQAKRSGRNRVVLFSRAVGTTRLSASADNAVAELTTA